MSMPEQLGGSIRIDDAYVTEGREVSAAYFTVSNDGDEGGSVIAVTTPLAASSWLATTRTQGGMEFMQPAATLEVPARGHLRLAPGGAHVMLEQLREVLEPGRTIPLEVTFDGGERITVAAPVLSYLETAERVVAPAPMDDGQGAPVHLIVLALVVLITTLLIGVLGIMRRRRAW